MEWFMCAKRTDKSSEDQEGTETQSAEQLADAPVEQVEVATDKDATSEPGFALVLDDEINRLLGKLKSGDALNPQEEMRLNLHYKCQVTSSNTMSQSDLVAQDVVQTQAVDAQETVQPAADEEPGVELNSVDVVEVLAVTSKSATGFHRAGLKFERLNAIPVEVLADGSGLVGDYPLTISQVQAIRDEPHLKCEVIHDGVTV
jgi:hypothetical protein